MSTSATPVPAGAALAGAQVTVVGVGVSGAAAAGALAARGARVVVVDAADGPGQRAAAERLRAEGIEVRLGGLPAEAGAASLVVTSPGVPPDTPLLRAAEAAGVPVWGEVELAWRWRGLSRWLAVTGTNGKTTTTEMLGAMLVAGGRRATTAGNIGTPIVAAVETRPPYDALAVELSSFQLHYTSTVAPRAAVILNVAPDHLDWHGGADAYAAAKARIWAAPHTVAVGNVDDPVSLELLSRAPGRRVTFGLDPNATPRPDLTVVNGYLVDRAFSGGRLIAVADLGAAGRSPGRRPPATGITGGGPAGGRVGGAVAGGTRAGAAGTGDGPGPFGGGQFRDDRFPGFATGAELGSHNIANALAAAALARADGVDPAAIGAALASFRPGAHRNVTVGRRGGVRYVDDSKATNPHAAAASLRAYPSVVWIAGGLNKGLEFDDLVVSARHGLRAVVLIGQCADEVAAALARHAPDVPVERAAGMDDAVEAAAKLAAPGDTVLLAPAAASMDMFRDYAERGDLFAAAVRARGG
ncbi:UDP-N-acetylmuramoyl-L-alanine--D-glutamate ligase [Parafrankia sp. BMG5.11]|uniref:UDP-N-acetylmuramoyl-L-alanine--D-glutamate ligase n=1 Tax=Parafrankia sp. BMG5.11 TaxID=222540 RepID=UPI00103ABFA8|nr:UDP-N-acetylmuramoyl-L-alanine--D-glutamate ligase [Parafrankia sp. BMG5.11]TCJ36233.1 UDP-N-acetylmuramoyl-L-alanine--D-glutamate ligase [Parafrankia sp. BMG5.11]CAI7977956.1 UDP-N-acetylmuramoylalanine--D-glutamate ligase [Frankia sp. Hr75.2]